LGGRQQWVAADAVVDIVSVAKNIDLMSIGTKSNRSHPPPEKNEPSIPNIGHNMASMCNVAHG
jgi:hypothetical protein